MPHAGINGEPLATASVSKLYSRDKFKYIDAYKECTNDSFCLLVILG